MKPKYLLMLILALAACSKEERGRRDSSREPSDDPRPSSAFIENPAWTITYTGREAMLDGGLTYVVDVLHLKSSDDKTWYLDLVSANDMLKEYKGSIDAFISASLEKALKNGDIDVSKSDGDVVYDILDGGGCNWVAVAYGCDAKGNLTGDYTRLDFTTQEVELKKTDDFKMEYNGRKTIREGGKDVDVDELSVKSSKPYSYYVYLAYPEYVAEEFDNNWYDFFNSVVDEVYDGLNEDEEFADALYYKEKLNIQFDRLRSGNWTAYAIGLDAAGNFLGYWSEYTFNIPEEKPTDEFNRWLGTWKISGNDISYDITVSNSESNVAYLVSGWETGDFQADEYTSDFAFETRFDRETGDMVFYVQYIGYPYDDNGETFDLYLLGVYKDKGEEYVYEYESDIARASFDTETTAKVVALSCDKGTFVSMRYADLSRDASNTEARTYAPYVPYFPLTMTWISSNVSHSAAPLHKTASARKAGAASSLRRAPAARKASGPVSIGGTTRRGNNESTSAAGKAATVRRTAGDTPRRRV